MASRPLHACEAALTLLPEKLLVGVSGGVDSMALLQALVAAGKKPVVLHFDHGWRKESAADAALVRKETARLELPFIGGRARDSVKKRENDARAARYAFFVQTANRLKILDLVLAHHADDQVETFLMQLLRGTGADGRGMDSLKRRDTLTIHRPWLGIWKTEIVAYARAKKLAWSEDSTNADLQHRRNLIRRRILPYLKKQWSPQVGENLLRAAEILRAEGEWLDALCAEMAKSAELPVKILAKNPVAQQRRTMLRWLQRQGVQDISFADVEAVRGLLANRNPSKVNLSAGKFARRREGKIFVE